MTLYADSNSSYEASEAIRIGRIMEEHGRRLGYVGVVHFASFIPNAGPFREFKGNSQLQFQVQCKTSSLRAERGVVRCPTGIGFGVTIDAEIVNRATLVTL